MNAMQITLTANIKPLKLCQLPARVNNNSVISPWYRLHLFTGENEGAGKSEYISLVMDLETI